MTIKIADTEPIISFAASHLKGIPTVRVSGCLALPFSVQIDVSKVMSTTAGKIEPQIANFLSNDSNTFGGPESWHR